MMNTEATGRKTAYPQFDNLRHLALDPNQAEAFFEAAHQELGRLADEMIKVMNTDKLLEGYYRARMTLIRALMAVECDFLSYIHRNAPRDRKDS